MIAALAMAGAAPARPLPGAGGGGVAIPPASDALPTADSPTWGPPGTAAPGAADALSADPVARGRYLATAGDCAACHTRVGGAAYAGGRPINTPIGVIFSSNITPDPATGLGAWTADAFFRAVHKGIGQGGRPLYPAFPYPYFAHLTRADSDGLFAYLKTLRPVTETPPPNKLPFPVNLRFLMWIWDALFFRPATLVADPARSAAWNRGAYLVQGPGHCGACHTPKNFLGADRSSRALQGGRIDNWAAVNLAGDVRDGLGDWSKDDIAEYLRTGRNARTAASGSMTEVIYRSTSRLSDADLAAIATYLKGLAPSGRTAPLAPSGTPMLAGEAIFLDSCAACHRADGEGAPRLFPPLRGDAALQGTDATTVVRIILGGSRAVPTPGAPTPLTMPSYADKLSDPEIASVATYVRNTWGNAAPRVTASQVAALRRRLSF
jgi:mono/diheme cytochrome c family protein